MGNENGKNSELDIDIFLDEPEIIKIRHKEYKISGLSPFQAIKIGRVFSKSFIGATKETIGEIGKGSTDLEDLFTIAEKMKKEDLCEIIRLFLNAPIEDKEFINKNLSLELMTEVFAIVLEKNNMEKILGNVMRAVKAMGKKENQEEKNKMTSLPPSSKYQQNSPVIQ